jgi:hypothetical protein
MISASTGSTTNRDDELVGQIERFLHRPIIPESWFFCQLTLKSTQIAEKLDDKHAPALEALARHCRSDNHRAYDRSRLASALRGERD